MPDNTTMPLKLRFLSLYNGISRLSIGVTVLLVLLIQFGNIYSMLDIPLLRDEAYYWLWSTRLAGGYFDHPPMVAWAIALSTNFFGDTQFAVRLPGLFAWLLGIVLFYTLAHRCFASRRAGVLAVGLMLICPMFQTLLNVVTPDTFLFIFTLLYLVTLFRVLRHNKLADWLFLGLVTGGLGLSKYTSILAPAVLVVSMLLSTSGRKMLCTSGPWFAALVSLLVLSPLLWWNFTHDWASFDFQLRHGLETANSKQQEHLVNFGEYLTGQMMLPLLPLFFITLIVGILHYQGLRQHWRIHTLGLLNCIGVFCLTLVLFGITMTLKKGEPNWTAIAYIPGLLLLSGILERMLNSRVGSVFVHIMFPITALLTLVLLTVVKYPARFESVFNTTITRTQITHTYGWDALQAPLRDSLSNNPDYTAGKCSILTGGYAEAAWLVWHLGSDHKNQVQTAPGSRISQFDIWKKHTNLPACFFLDESRDVGNSEGVITLGAEQWQRLWHITSTHEDATSTEFMLYQKTTR